MQAGYLLISQKSPTLGGFFKYFIALSFFSVILKLPREITEWEIISKISEARVLGVSYILSCKSQEVLSQRFLSISPRDLNKVTFEFSRRTQIFPYLWYFLKLKIIVLIPLWYFVNRKKITFFNWKFHHPLESKKRGTYLVTKDKYWGHFSNFEFSVSPNTLKI